MKIIKCPKCGKYLHKARVCLFCRYTNGFQELSEETIHKNIGNNYALAIDLVEKRNFNEALNLTYSLIEWMPNFSEVYWLRLLAKHESSSDFELINKGFDCIKDPDFLNALKFSDEEYKKIYLEIGEIIKNLKNLLKRELVSQCLKKKSETGIVRLKESYPHNIDRMKKELFDLWTDLEKIEHELFSLQQDCCILTNEHTTSLEQASKNASLLWNQINKLNECEEELFHSYQVKMSSIKRQSEQAKKAIEDMKKNHSLVKKYNEKKADYDKQIDLIKSELKTVRKYENTINYTIKEVEQIETVYKNAIISTEKYDFSKGFALLEMDTINKILQTVGVDCVSLP